MGEIERLGTAVMEVQTDAVREMVHAVVHDVMAEEVEAVVGAAELATLVPQLP